MSVSEGFEQLIAFIGSQLPKPVDERQSDDGSIIFTGGQPSQVIVRLTEQTVVVAEFAEARRVDNFSIEPRVVGELYWQALPETSLMNALSALIKGARDARMSKFRVCSACGESTAPESLGLDNVCEE